MNTTHPRSTPRASALGGLLLAASVGLGTCGLRAQSDDTKPAHVDNLPAQETTVVLEGGKRVSRNRSADDGRRAQADTKPGTMDAHGRLPGVLAGGGGHRNLVVPAAGTEPDKLARVDEDLAVMSRILDKSLDKSGRRENSFRVLFGPDGGPGDFDALYLDGYGALFLLSVDFPLVEPPKAEKTKKESNEDQDKTWEQTRREVQGGRQSGIGFAFEDADDRDDAPEFDGNRVTELKRQVIGALKHASNLSAVKSSEGVAIVVFSRAGAGYRHAFDLIKGMPGNGQWAAGRFPGGGGGGGGMSGNGFGGGGPGEHRRQQLTFRAQKTDIDAFAKGRLSLDEFTHKVTVTAN